MKEKSLMGNAFLSGGQKLLSIIFPLITFPYISRILLVEDVGKINFVTSIISYFLLIAGLGINNYAIREGAKIREDKEKLNKFASEMYSINIFTTIITYILLIIVSIVAKDLKEYYNLLLIHSISILGTTIGVNWIYSIYEDYLYITMRTLVIQLISLILMFILVKEPNDYIIYTMITVFANIGGNIFNFIHSKKYVTLKLTLKTNIKKHIKPILIIFASSIAVTIYVNSDMTMLGIFCDDYNVGLYSRSVRIYTIVKQMIAAMVVVMLPRLSNEILNNKKEDYEKHVRDVFLNIIMFALPIGIGLFCTADNIMIIIAGKKYVEAINALSVLGISSIFAVMSSFTTYCILLPLKLEKIQMKATYISAIINVILNVLILSAYKQDGAAYTTLISEAFVFFIEYIYILKYTEFKHLFKLSSKEVISLIVANVYILCVVNLINCFTTNVIVLFILKIVFSAAGYFGILYIYKYPSVKKIYNKFFNKIMRENKI